jgi:MerR family transcriptional regulator, light-induced transcriptional regulator
MTVRATSALSDEYVAALLAGDGTRARHVIDSAVAGGVPVPELYLEVLAPALERVGELWARGEINVAYEHYATAVTQGIVGALGPRIRRAPRGGRLAVLSCSPGELHALGPQMAGDLLEAAGWEVLLLGAATPAHDLAALVEAERPDVVGLSTATTAVIDQAVEAVGVLARLRPRPFIVVGGGAWRDVRPDRVQEIGADAHVSDAADGVALVTERFPPVREG